MAFSQVPSFGRDSRANQIVGFEVEDTGRGSQKLYLHGPREATEQIMHACLGGYTPGSAEPPLSERYMYCLEFRGRVPDEVLELARLLQRVLILTTRANLKLALALDWHKVPDDGPSDQWSHTDMGRLVYEGKYRKQRASFLRLGEQLSGVVRTHPSYRRARYVVTVPGHDPSVRSFGEALGEYVAHACGKSLVKTIGEPRPERKERSALTASFKMPARLSGDVVVVDDVFGSGLTLSAVADAARRAGAYGVYGVVATRRLRK